MLRILDAASHLRAVVWTRKIVLFAGQQPCASVIDLKACERKTQPRGHWREGSATAPWDEMRGAQA